MGYQRFQNKNIPIIDLKLSSLVREDMGTATYLKEIAFRDIINDSQTSVNCYFISLDGNKRPRVKDFARFIAEKIIDYVIPREEFARALYEAEISNSSSPIVRLNNRAKRLFTSLPKSGEGGEILLSVLAETFLGLPQLFTKMVLKTDSEMHVHGCDGIHGGVNESGHLALYWGESKLYSSATDAVRECFSSLAPFLLNNGGSYSEQERDLQLMRDGINLNDSNLTTALKSYLDPNNPMFNEIEYRGLCLVGFDCDKYPNVPNSKEINQLREEINNVYKERREHIKKRIFAEQVESFVIELFLIPFPDVNDFRVAFRNEIGVGNE